MRARRPRPRLLLQWHWSQHASRGQGATTWASGWARERALCPSGTGEKKTGGGSRVQAPLVARVAFAERPVKVQTRSPGRVNHGRQAKTLFVCYWVDAG